MKKNYFYHFILIFIITILDFIISQLLPYYLRPNFFITFIVFSALFLNHYFSTLSSFILGITYDFFHLEIFGINTLIFTIIGYLTGFLNKRLNETSHNAQIFVLCISYLIYYFLYLLFLKKNINFYHVINLLINITIGFLTIQLFKFYYQKLNLI